MNPGQIIDIANRFRAEMLAHDAATLNTISGYYRDSMQRLSLKFADLTQLIIDAYAEGKVPVARTPGKHEPLKPDEFSISWLQRQQRYNDLLDSLEKELQEFGKLAAKDTEAAQLRMGLLAEQHSLKLMAEQLGPPPEGFERAGLTVTWNQPARGAITAMAGVLSDGSPLAYKFAELAPTIKEQAKQTIMTGLIRGLGPRQIADNLDMVTGGGLANALTTARTETLRVYRHSAHVTMQANTDVMKGWVRSAARNTRTCAACWAQDGTFHELSEELTDHPNGRCVAIPVTKTWAELFPDMAQKVTETSTLKGWNAERYFKKLSPKEQRAVLGPTKYRAWRDGVFELRDVAQIQRSAVWGDHWRVGTLDEIAQTVAARIGADPAEILKKIKG